MNSSHIPVRLTSSYDRWVDRQFMFAFCPWSQEACHDPKQHSLPWWGPEVEKENFPIVSLLKGERTFLKLSPEKAAPHRSLGWKWFFFRKLKPLFYQHWTWYYYWKGWFLFFEGDSSLCVKKNWWFIFILVFYSFKVLCLVCAVSSYWAFDKHFSLNTTVSLQFWSFYVKNFSNFSFPLFIWLFGDSS